MGMINVNVSHTSGVDITLHVTSYNGFDESTTSSSHDFSWGYAKKGEYRAVASYADGTGYSDSGTTELDSDDDSRTISLTLSNHP